MKIDILEKMIIQIANKTSKYAELKLIIKYSKEYEAKDKWF